jgi:hypothetical protein
MLLVFFREVIVVRLATRRESSVISLSKMNRRRGK